MATEKTGIQTKFFRNMIFIALVSIGLWSLIWIHGEYSAFKTESKGLRTKYIDAQKKMLKSEVASVVQYVQYMKDQAGKELEQNLKERVDEAHQIALNIYRQNKASKTKTEIGNMIKDALRPIRFNAGRGYYFAVSLDGVEQLYPVRPEFEGENLIDLKDSKGNFVIRDEIDIIRKSGEGFVTDWWAKPDEDTSVLFPKISFVKHFKPLDWYFGAGEYLDDAKKQLQDEVLNRLSGLRFGIDGYFFGSTFKGASLFSNGKVTLGTGSIWDLTDPNGVKIIQEQQDVAKNPDGGYVHYSWPKINGSTPLPKISYVLGISEWGWTIGAGIYLDTIETDIRTKKIALNIGIRKKILNSAVVMLLLLLLIYFWSRRVSGQITKAIETFSLSLVKSSADNTAVNPMDLHLREFRDIAALTNEMITARKQAEEEIKQLSQFRELIIDNANIWLNVLDEKGNVVIWNKAAESISGYSKEEVVGHGRIWEWSYPDDKYREEMFAKATAIIEKHEVLEDFETTIHRKDGKKRDMSWHSRNLLNDQGKPIGSIALGRDVTERKRAQEALRVNEEKFARLKKMESLGLLAGGVAHDLNNVLSGIVSYPELILMDLPEDSKLRKPVETIQTSGHRAAAIVQDLLTVARGVATAKEPLNLNHLLEEYLKSPEFNRLKSFYPTVTVKSRLDADLLNVRGSQVHIRKVVMNLVSNASEAIDGNGIVTLITENRYVDTPLRGYDDVNIGEYAVLAVSDNGSGISSDDLERIFEPFYTKKIMGRSGTGLGLAVVWNTLQDHNGYIDVKSDEKGTTFELYFPITREAISGKDVSLPIDDYKGNGEMIMVVDDEESQREITCKMLETLGYNAHAVPGGEEAVSYLRANDADLILLDMIMEPGINGRETYERIIRMRPHQKAIILSGFAETDDVKEAQKLGAGQYIKKPITLEKIGLAILEELEK